MKETFIRNSDESLILIKCDLNKHEFSLALDTGASHTTIDLTTLLIAGYDNSYAIKTVSVETASGIIEAKIFILKEFKALGITRKNFEVCVYDFFEHQLLTEFDGVLGLDFISEFKICIDFKISEITLT